MLICAVVWRKLGLFKQSNSPPNAIKRDWPTYMASSQSLTDNGAVMCNIIRKPYGGTLGPV
jgi:hypothetical protein